MSYDAGSDSIGEYLQDSLGGSESQIAEIRSFIDTTAKQYFKKENGVQTVDQMIAARRAALNDLCKSDPGVVGILDDYVDMQITRLATATFFSDKEEAVVASAREVSAYQGQMVLEQIQETKIDTVLMFDILFSHANNYKGQAHFSEKSGDAESHALNAFHEYGRGYYGHTSQRELVHEILTDGDAMYIDEEVIAMRDFVLTMGLLVPTKADAKRYFSERVGYGKKAYKTLGWTPDEIQRDLSIEKLIETFYGETPNRLVQLGRNIVRYAGNVLARGVDALRTKLTRDNGLDIGNMDDSELLVLRAQIENRLGGRGTQAAIIDTSRLANLNDDSTAAGSSEADENSGTKRN